MLELDTREICLWLLSCCLERHLIVLKFYYEEYLETVNREKEYSRRTFGSYILSVVWHFAKECKQTRDKGILLVLNFKYLLLHPPDQTCQHTVRSFLILLLLFVPGKKTKELSINPLMLFQLSATPPPSLATAAKLDLMVLVTAFCHRGPEPPCTR